MTDFIVDASVVAKWLLRETGSDRARLLISKQYHLRAPDLLVAELASVLWKKTTRGEITPEEMHSMMQVLLRDHIDVKVRLLPSRILVKQALEIATGERQSTYDSLYLASAVQARCRLVTADTRFVRSVKSPLLKPHIVSLDDPELDLSDSA